MAGSFQSNDIQVKDILYSIAKGTIQLPDFQRGWVWDDFRIRSLIASITRSYPVGAVMFLEYGGDNIRFKYRGFTGTSITTIPEKLVLDGQQRLTSMFCPLFSRKVVETMTEKKQAINRWYYLDINKALDPGTDRLEAIIGIPEDRMLKANFDRDIVLDISSREKEYENHLFPLNISYDISGTMQWITGYNLFHKNDPQAPARIDMFADQVLSVIQSYDIPIITLNKKVPKEAVCQVFENVNTGGVSLTVFELVTASFAADDFDLRKDWENRQDEFATTKLLGEVTATDFLASLTLLVGYKKFKAGGAALSCKKKDILNITLDEYKANADAISAGYRDAEKFLKEQRIFTSRDLPYNTQVIPLAAIYAYLESRQYDTVIKVKIEKWYWCGVLGEMYGGANETRYTLDMAGVIDWIDNDSTTPDTVTRAYFNVTRLLTLQTRLSAAYKGLMALILKSGCKDFISSSPMDFTTFLEENTDIHHIFPHDYCEAKKLPREKWNSIINKTPLFYRTNRIIGGSAPSKYLKKIETNIAIESLDLNLASHLIDVSAIRADDFDTYFIQRAKMIVGLIEGAMGKPVSGKETDETVSVFGAKLMQ
jgi:hypothetical protein